MLRDLILRLQRAFESTIDFLRDCDFLIPI